MYVAIWGLCWRNFNARFVRSAGVAARIDACYQLRETLQVPHLLSQCLFVVFRCQVLKGL